MTEPAHKTELPTSSLPDIIPVFPMPGVVLLPRGRLPLNIYEPHYMSMMEDALGQGRLVGIIQPVSGEDKIPVPPLYQIGCAGRITSFSETEDGRFLVNLLGVCRFSVSEELHQIHGYRRIRPSWQQFLGDVGPVDEVPFDRPRLVTVLRYYFKAQGIAADWSAVQNTSGESLISSLAMICPFEPNEKQALVEAPDLQSRAKLLIALLEMACLPQHETDNARH